jgi:LacI family transcriptional regulator
MASNRNSRVSLSDIARAAGVSKMSVSLALRENGRLHANTAERIRQTAQRLGYMPNPQLSQVMAETARTRHSAQNGTLAFVITEPVGKVSGEEEKSFNDALQRAGTYGYRMESFWISDPSLSPSRFNRILWSRGIEGIIIPNISARLYAQGQRTLPVEWEKFCVVEIGGSMLQPDVNRVRHDHFGAMIKALRRLEHLNYRRIGLCLSSEVDLRTHHRWSAAYLLWRELRPDVASLKPLLLEVIDPGRVVAWARQNRLDAVLSPGRNFLDALREGGMDVPGDIGFASLHIFGEGADQMTGIDQDPTQLATSAVDTLVTLIHRRERGVPEHPIELLSGGRWQDGETAVLQPPSGELPDPDNQILHF